METISLYSFGTGIGATVGSGVFVLIGLIAHTQVGAGVDFSTGTQALLLTFECRNPQLPGRCGRLDKLECRGRRGMPERRLLR